MKSVHWIVASAVVIGVILRVWTLDDRTMHTDEAVHAVKFGALLEHGEYRYDEKEYHGPLLNYLTLVPAWILGRGSLGEIDERVLRSIPAFFGILLIPLPLLLRGLKNQATTIVLALTALSPAMVFYSRYYIQEILLVFFTFGLIISLHYLVTTSRAIWAAAVGISGGLMHATKETSIIAFLVIGASGLIIWLIRKIEGRSMHSIRPLHLVIAVFVGCGVSAVFYSSFFTHWTGVLDSFRTYITYFERASNGAHLHSWYYYLHILLGWQVKGGIVWSEGAIVLFGIVGMIVSFRRFDGAKDGGDLQRFLALYTLLMFLVYSAIPYKTPWSILGGLHGMIVMAGVGIAHLMRYVERMRFRWIAPIGLVIILGHLGAQAYSAGFIYQESPENPYVYAQSTKDVQRLAAMVELLVTGSPANVSVQIVCTGDDYWPLPWYLRRLSRVGWWNSFTDVFVCTPVILVSPDLEPELLKRLYETPSPGQRKLYVPVSEKTFMLRPGKEIRAYATLDLMNAVGISERE